MRSYAKGAQEVWIVYEDTTVEIHTHTGLQEQSQFSESLANEVLTAIKNNNHRRSHAGGWLQMFWNNFTHHMLLSI